ncbi:unnamed protein product, partial [Pelagomonas calceolata]
EHNSTLLSSEGLRVVRVTIRRAVRDQPRQGRRSRRRRRCVHPPPLQDRRGTLVHLILHTRRHDDRGRRRLRRVRPERPHGAVLRRLRFRSPLVVGLLLALRVHHVAVVEGPALIEPVRHLDGGLAVGLELGRVLAPGHVLVHRAHGLALLLLFLGELVADLFELRFLLLRGPVPEGLGGVRVAGHGFFMMPSKRTPGPRHEALF